MGKEYVEKRDGGYFVAGTRVSLDSVVYAFLRGESPEGIVESYPALSMEEVFGALSFYLAERNAIDDYLRKEKQDFEILRQQARKANPALYAKLLDARQKTSSPNA
jgi:uncharacterized protein (DUF433 family)